MSDYRSLAHLRSRDEPKAFPTRWDYGLLIVAIIATLAAAILAWVYV